MRRSSARSRCRSRTEYDDPDATANANLAARLPYLFACCRFAHYLKCIVRDKIGSFKERDDMQRWLQNWIMNYVDGDPAHSSETTKAQKPLAAAEVAVEEVEGNPGLLHLEVLPAAALSAGGPDGVAAAGVEAAVGQGRLMRVCSRWDCITDVAIDDCAVRQRSGHMAVDVFSEDRRHQGRVEGRKHKDEIDVLVVVSWGVSQTRHHALTAAAAAPAKRTSATFSFMHDVDKASPVLVMACATGEHIKEATLTVRKAGKGQQEYLIVKMNDVLDHERPGLRQLARMPMESVSLNFAKVELEYKLQKEDGSLAPGVQFKYDLKGNKDSLSRPGLAPTWCRPPRSLFAQAGIETGKN